MASMERIGAAAVELMEAETWSWPVRIGYTVVVLGGLELVSRFVLTAFSGAEKIPIKGKHHDKLTTKDKCFIAFNKATVVVFTWHMLSYIWQNPKVVWALEDATALNTAAAAALLYVVYDFFYTLFHRFLHVKAIYGYVHKHHHIQKAPSRGNVDAVNVHPFEFVCGEYNHILALFILTTFMEVHVLAAGLFILAGGALASLNHTRYDVSIPGIYDVKYHDVHHRIPQSNYGQYIMLWDHLMGSFREYV
uniref:Fatty acid hydroxylase domain-containing protein n=1 Tax=Phaeomonas parva TaxID=124430 RepID=A0A7S1U5D6_9STRA|mmetsp:Transcript_32419/g.103001  ORF Transcript_32419/g.103001 Transcript_32419/m.103001 type:complete len:249 (+) Transcript_32419:147-893(+)